MPKSGIGHGGTGTLYNFMETIFRKIRWKLYFGKFDGNYISEKLIETILWKIGMDNLMEQLWRASESRIVKRSEANTTRSSQYQPTEQPFGATSANERSE